MGALRAAMDVLRDEDITSSPAVILGADLIELDRLAARLRYEQSRRAVAFDSSGGAQVDGMPTAAAWLRTRTTAGPGESRELEVEDGCESVTGVVNHVVVQGYRSAGSSSCTIPGKLDLAEPASGLSPDRHTPVDLTQNASTIDPNLHHGLH